MVITEGDSEGSFQHFDHLRLSGLREMTPLAQAGSMLDAADTFVWGIAGQFTSDTSSS